ncbi:hypothetical protein RB595_008108 [Gaeumannomyces hyphopodioides]
MKLLPIVLLAFFGIAPATASGVSLQYRFTVSRLAAGAGSQDSAAGSDLVPVVTMNQPLGSGVLHSVQTSVGLGPGCEACEGCIHSCDDVFEDLADWARCTAVCFDSQKHNDCRNCPIPEGRFDVFMNIADIAATTDVLERHGLLGANLSTDDASRRWKQSGLKLANLVELRSSLPANASESLQEGGLVRNCSVCNAVVAACLIFMWLPFIWLPCIASAAGTSVCDCCLEQAGCL